MKYQKEAEVVDAYQTVGPVVVCARVAAQGDRGQGCHVRCKGSRARRADCERKNARTWGHWIVRYESGVLNILPDCYFTKTYKPVE